MLKKIAGQKGRDSKREKVELHIDRSGNFLKVFAFLQSEGGVLLYSKYFPKHFSKKVS